MMYKVFYSLISIIWILDILQISFMNFLDTSVPINALAWFLIFVVMPDPYENK